MILRINIDLFPKPINICNADALCFRCGRKINFKYYLHSGLKGLIKKLFLKLFLLFQTKFMSTNDSRGSESYAEPDITTEIFLV
jgi:hypothetical protein